jgi:hypothetical protein
VAGRTLRQVAEKGAPLGGIRPGLHQEASQLVVVHERPRGVLHPQAQVLLRALPRGLVEDGSEAEPPGDEAAQPGEALPAGVEPPQDVMGAAVVRVELQRPQGAQVRLPGQ